MKSAEYSIVENEREKSDRKLYLIREGRLAVDPS